VTASAWENLISSAAVDPGTTRSNASSCQTRSTRLGLIPETAGEADHAGHQVRWDQERSDANSRAAAGRDVFHLRLAGLRGFARVARHAPKRQLLVSTGARQDRNYRTTCSVGNRGTAVDEVTRRRYRLTMMSCSRKDADGCRHVGEEGSLLIENGGTCAWPATPERASSPGRIGAPEHG
jgi:hypothetical protein